MIPTDAASPGQAQTEAQTEPQTETEPQYARLHAELATLWFGERPVDAVVERLGPSRSGSENLDFYRVLVQRNFAKIVRELFPVVQTVCDRVHPGLWPTLVRDFARDRPSNARDPNWVGEPFSAWLAERRESHPEQSVLLEELADFAFVRFAAAHAPDDLSEHEHEHDRDRDGFERRLFVRLYSHPVPELALALADDPDAPLPGPRASPTLIFRSLLDGESVRRRTATLAELAALARRQGLPLPEPMADLPAETVDAAEARLVARGVLTQNENSSP